MLMFFSMLVLEAHAQQGEDQSWVSKNELFTVRVESELNPIVINQIHSWTLQVQDAKGQPLAYPLLAACRNIIMVLLQRQ